MLVVAPAHWPRRDVTWAWDLKWGVARAVALPSWPASPSYHATRLPACRSQLGAQVFEPAAAAALFTRELPALYAEDWMLSELLPTRLVCATPVASFYTGFMVTRVGECVHPVPLEADKGGSASLVRALLPPETVVRAECAAARCSRTPTRLSHEPDRSQKLYKMPNCV